jgi:hypothetical protein
MSIYGAGEGLREMTFEVGEITKAREMKKAYRFYKGLYLKEG